MRWRRSPFHFELSLVFWLLRAALIGANIHLAVAVAAQSNLDTLLGQARTAEQAGDYAGAERVYEEALRLAPGNLEVLKRFGVLEQTELKFDDSIAHFRQVLAREPQYPEVNFFLGVSYFGKNNFPQAIESFNRELAVAKPHPRCRYYLALALQSSGRMADAISQLNLSLVENPRDGDSLYELARLHKNASFEAIERLKALDPDSFQLHALMGEIYSDEERYPEAIKQYQSALNKRPEAHGIHFSIGVAYWAQHQIDNAQKEFMLAWKENSDDPMTNLYLGDIAVAERRFEEALSYLRVSQKAHIDLPQLHLLLGKCYRAQNDLQGARTEFLAAMEADPTAAAPHYLLAQVYRELHDADSSTHELREFERLSKLAAEKSEDSRGDALREKPK